MKLKKVKIMVQPVEGIKSEWAHALKGEVRSIQHPGVIIFTSLAAVAKVLSPARMELLGVILKEKPISVYALAKLIGRDFKNVHSDVRLLVEIGFVALKRSGARAATKPVARYSGYELDLAA